MSRLREPIEHVRCRVLDHLARQEWHDSRTKDVRRRRRPVPTRGSLHDSSPSPVSSVSTSPGPPATAHVTTPQESSGLTFADAATCEVTLPGTTPAEIGTSLFGSGAAFGNDDLWVGGHGEGGVIQADPQLVESDGSIGWKLGWYRVLSGTLTMDGRRLDADAPPLRSSVPDGYGTHGFRASGVYFPTEGCWEVTGHLGAPR